MSDGPDVRTAEAARDESIVRALAAAPRDQRLWLAFYDKLRPPLYYSMYRLCRGERELARDLTQEAFERFFRYAELSRFDSDAHALAYLRQIARFELRDELFHRRRERTSQATLLEPAAEPVAPERAEDAAEEAEALADLAMLARDLSAEEQALLNRLLAGKKVTEIAQALHLSYGTAAVRVHRLMNKIRSQFNSLR